ncbi:MAG: hypothetical protein Q8O67_15330 [Deltaproteobacteria bacterium]|nr:hypothetical protein [Deltaproteobacteria bacterium]
MSAEVTQDLDPFFAGDEIAAELSGDQVAVPNVAELIAQASEQLKVVDDGIRKFVSEKPGVALVGAVAIGFLVGRLLSR